MRVTLNSCTKDGYVYVLTRREWVLILQYISPLVIVYPYIFLLGDVAWRLYSDKFSIDLIMLMAEERNLTIDWNGFELAKQRAQVCYYYYVH